MTGKNAHEGFLRQLPSSGAGQERRYELNIYQEIVIGRDPSCEILLDSDVYGMVSRRHAAVRPVYLSAVGGYKWLVCDLNSANGTYLNGQKLQGCQELQGGDRIILGEDGAQFVFECQNHQQRSQAPSPFVPPTSTVGTNAINAAANSPDFLKSGDNCRPTPRGSFSRLFKKPGMPPNTEHSVSFTQLFPILSTGRDLTSKAYLYPGILTVVFVILMFATVGQPETAFFNQMVVATYLAGAAFYFVYQLCGKHKPWWVLLASAVATVLILLSPVLSLFLIVFRSILPGRIPTEVNGISFPELFVRMFFGAGLMEELLKALPIFAFYLLARRMRSPWRERIGVLEPLDGILLGTASAVGFTLLETLGQYVPEIIRNVTLQAGPGIGQLVGLQLLIPRILGSVAGHMAYSGYFGYFIGLSVLKPRKSWQILAVGYFTASALHALWNATGIFSALLLAVVGVLSYAFLTAAILKARALSPTRSSNFATRLRE